MGWLFKNHVFFFKIAVILSRGTCLSTFCSDFCLPFDYKYLLWDCFYGLVNWRRPFPKVIYMHMYFNFCWNEKASFAEHNNWIITLLGSFTDIYNLPASQIVLELITDFKLFSQNVNALFIINKKFKSVKKV